MTTQRHSICWASLVTGLALGGIALSAMLVDLRNNWHYGQAISLELGLVMVLAAIGVTALPTAAAMRGWDWLLRLGTTACVLLTIWAAISAYADRQGREILERQASNVAYESAQRDAEMARQHIELARSEAARIAETATVAELELLVREAQAAAEREANRGGCGRQCEARKSDVAAFVARLGEARAKEAAFARITAAQKRLDAAKVEAKTGPAEVSMLASFVAERTGHDAADIARSIALSTTALAILTTLFMALLMHQAVSLILQGFGVAQGKTLPQPAGQEPEIATPLTLTTKPQIAAETPIAEDLKPVDRDALISQFIKSCLCDGGPVTGGRLYDAFCEWWTYHAAGELVPSMNVLFGLMKELGFEKRRIAGRMLYPVQIVPLDA